MTLTGLGVGAHAFRVRSRDGAGNVDASPATRAWTVRAATSPPGPGTDTSSGTPVTSPAPPVKPFDPRITSLFFYKGTKTRFTRLVVTDLPKGAKVNASCKGKGCAFKDGTSIRTAGAKLNVLKKLKRVRLRSGAVLQLKITAPTGELKLRYVEDPHRQGARDLVPLRAEGRQARPLRLIAAARGAAAKLAAP